MSMVSNPGIVGSGGMMDPSMTNTQQANGNGYYNNNRRSFNAQSYNNNGNGRMNYNNNNNYGNGSNYFEDWSKPLPADDIIEK